MSWQILLAAFLGYTIGDLPDHGIAWTSLKFAATILALVLVVRLARREAKA